MRRLAVGGMAEVYVAKTKGIGGFEKLIAIKVIHPRFSEDDHFVQMLVEEAKITVQLNHVNIAQTFDLGCIDDTYYIAMEFVEGADFYRCLKRSKDKMIGLPIDICCYVISEVCNGLGYAHRKRDHEGRAMGIVHRDISPQNVLTTFAGEVKIVDFGIAKAAMRSGQTEVGVIKGKYYYMSPEQAWGDPVDQRSDIFSTAILLYELLTGEMVYQENNVPALLDRVRKAEIPSSRAIRPEIPEAIDRVMLKALAKEPADRYQSAHAFGQDLSELLYKTNPTFTASRLAQLMGTLFPDDVKQRHSQILELPPAEVEAAKKRLAPAPPEPNEEDSLDAMAPDEFIPKENSVVFDLDEVDGDEHTRNDILPFQKMLAQKQKAERATRQLSAAELDDDPPTDERRTDGSEWEDETFLKDKPEWDESTLIEDDGDAFLAVHQQIAAMRAAPPPPDDEPEELQGEKTVATANPLAFLPTAVARQKPNPVPAAKTAPRAFRKPGAAKPPSIPPPASLPRKGGIPPPRRRIPKAPKNPVPWSAEPPTLDDEIPEMSSGPITAPADLPQDLPGESTVAFAEGVPPRPGGAIVGQVSGGVRLGPGAERYFPQSEPDPQGAPTGPFDPLGGTPAPQQQGGPPLSDDPFTARPPPPGAQAPLQAQLGKPEPKRWILPVIGVVVFIVLASVGGAYIAARPDPTTLEVISVPEGASVRIDGETLADRTPVTLTDRSRGQTVEVMLTHQGYDELTEQFALEEGENRRVFLLNPVRVTLHVVSQPAGVQIWVDGVLRGSAPLDISGLEIGQDLRLRGTLQGRQVEQSYQVGDERRQTVTLTVPAE